MAPEKETAALSAWWSLRLFARKLVELPVLFGLTSETWAHNHPPIIGEYMRMFEIWGINVEMKEPYGSEDHLLCQKSPRPAIWAWKEKVMVLPSWTKKTKHREVENLPAKSLLHGTGKRNSCLECMMVASTVCTKACWIAGAVWAY